jgi:hypothetical protein
MSNNDATPTPQPEAATAAPNGADNASPEAQLACGMLMKQDACAQPRPRTLPPRRRRGQQARAVRRPSPTACWAKDSLTAI